jgi:hypothetical protein
MSARRHRSRSRSSRGGASEIEDLTSSAGSDDNLKNLEWTDNLEALLARWSDEALSYAWLHVKSESKYRKMNYAFTIPIVVLSTLTGSINLAMSSMVPPQYATVGNLATGALSIFTGILGTLLNFFKYAQISEAHRNASVQWHKFYRQTKTELALDRACRKGAPAFYMAAKAEMDRLLDSSPNIPSEILQKYRERDSEVELPEIIGHLHRTRVYRGPQQGFTVNMDELGEISDLRAFQDSPTSRMASSSSGDIQLQANPLSRVVPNISAVSNAVSNVSNVSNVKTVVKDALKTALKDAVVNSLRPSSTEQPTNPLLDTRIEIDQNRHDEKTEE